MLLAGLVATYKKANLMLYTFSAADPVVKSRLLQSYCLSLYGCSLWDLSCASIHALKPSHTYHSMLADLSRVATLAIL